MLTSDNLYLAIGQPLVEVKERFRGIAHNTFYRAHCVPRTSLKFYFFNVHFPLSSPSGPMDELVPWVNSRRDSHLDTERCKHIDRFDFLVRDSSRHAPLQDHLPGRSLQVLVIHTPGRATSPTTSHTPQRSRRHRWSLPHGKLRQGLATASREALATNATLADFLGPLVWCLDRCGWLFLGNLNGYRKRSSFDWLRLRISR